MKLYSKGHTLYLTGGFPPSAGGSCVLNQNLLQGFDRDSFTVVSHRPAVNYVKLDLTISLYYPVRLFRRLNRVLIEWQKPLARIRLGKLVKRLKPELIIAAYPDLYFMELAHEISIKYQIPLVIYLHDTIYEAHRNTNLEIRALQLQNKLFNRASLIFVMSDGMRDLYLEKYGLETIPLRHTYESTSHIPKVESISKGIFWGGAIYQINAQAIARLSKTLAGTTHSLELASNTSKEKLVSLGMELSNIQLSFYADRTDYLKAVSQSKCLLLALDGPDDTQVDPDEISTIFPTKAVEYLFSDRPVLVICPRDYFLNRFFRENNCGFVVDDDRDEQQILDTLTLIDSRPDLVKEKVNNAKRIAALYFEGKKVRKILTDNLERLVS